MSRLNPEHKWRLSVRALKHLTLLAALVLMLIPVHGWLKLLQPYWLALVLIYWVMEEPDHSGLFTAFFYGLLLDVLSGSLLGKHSLSLLVIAYLVSKYARQFRMISFWQLSLIVGGLLLNDLFIRSLVDWLAHGSLPRLEDLLPVISGMLVWPWLKLLLDHLHARSRR